MDIYAVYEQVRNIGFITVHEGFITLYRTQISNFNQKFSTYIATKSSENYHNWYSKKLQHSAMIKQLNHNRITKKGKICVQTDVMNTASSPYLRTKSSVMESRFPIVKHIAIFKNYSKYHCRK